MVHNYTQLHNYQKHIHIERYRSTGNAIKIFHSNRMSMRMNLQWTMKELVDHSKARCSSNQKYNPDKEMMKIVILKSGCNLPWSDFQIDGFENCSKSF